MNRSTLLSGFAALVFAGVAAALLASWPADYTYKVAELEVKLKQATDEVARLKAELNEARASHAAASVPLSQSGKPTAEKPEESPSSKGPGAPSSMAKMFQDPKMREMIKAQQGMQIEMQYAKLIGKLQLDDKEAAHFKTLLSDRLSAKTDLGFKMMDAMMSKEQRNKVTGEYDTKKKASDDAIRQFLNDDTDYAAFTHWEDTEPERMQLMMGKGSFDATGAPLSPEQEEQLIDLMAKVRKEPGNLPDWNDPKSIDPTKMNDAFVDRVAKQQEIAAKKVLEGAAGFLSPDQQAALKKMQDQMRAMMDAGMKMSKAMMEQTKK